MGIDSEDFLYFSRNESLRLLLDAFVVNDEEETLLQRNATVDCVHPFFGMCRHARRGVLLLCRDVTPEEVCFVVTVGSFYLEELYSSCSSFHSVDLWSHRFFQTVQRCKS